MFASAIEEFTLQDLLSPAIVSNPYPTFRRLRQEAPVLEDPHGHGWILSRYDDIQMALADRRLSSKWIVSVEDRIRGVNPVIAWLSRVMLFQDPPDHTRLRGLVSKAFTPQRIEELRPKVLRMTTRLLDEAEADGGCIDFLETIANPLPVAVIAHMLGLPEEDHAQLCAWSWSFGSLINGCPLSSQEMMNAQRGIYALIRYLTKLIAEKRRCPGDDMLSDLIAAERDGDRLDAEELMMNVILLFWAGHGTTTHLLCNSVLALLRNPEEFRLLATDPTIGASAVNELLRYDGPIQMTTRLALADIEFGDARIRQGDQVTMLIASANHDESRFTNPDRLDLRRTGPRSLSFGHGMHSCVGAALGRMETQVVLSELARRFPSTWLDDNAPPRLTNMVFRGVETLPLVLA